MITASDIVLLSTAWRRPAYLEASLASWTRVRGAGELAHFVVALGPSGVRDDQVAVISRAADLMGLGGRMSILPDSPAAAAQPGMHRAIGEAARIILAELDPQAVIFTEEDIEVSDDVLEYFCWALTLCEDNPQVLTVCAHDEGGQGWHVPGIGARPGRDQAPQHTARLADDFNPWCWATWPDRLGWLLDRWDWDATLGGPMPSQHGYDWQIRWLTRGWGKTTVRPDASRSQNLGRDGGVYARPELYGQTLAASYRPHRDPIDYKLVSG
jgi:hypothetical protein